MVTQEWHTFFLMLRDAAGSDTDLQAQIDALAAKVAALPAGSGSATFSLRGIGSVQLDGSPAAGAVQIMLDGDSDAPGNTFYYGTGPDGLRGWHLVADAVGVTADLSRAVDATSNVVTIGLADLPNAGATGAALLKILRDAKGRVAGAAAATTDDLAEGATPTNMWFTGARARAALDAGRNLLINASMQVNQRNFGGGALAAGAYGYDRWRAGSGGCNVSVNSAGLISHTSGPLQQVIENPQGAWGQPLTLSVEDPSGSLSVSVGGATGTITAGSGRRSVTLTPTGSGNMTLQITATGVTYSRPQLERGSFASPFEYLKQPEEMALCQWYCRAGSLTLRSNGSATSGAGTWLPFSMRAAPTVTFSSVNYVYGCSSIDSTSSTSGVEIFVAATGPFAFIASYLLVAEL
ncbi:hypothetical protein ACP93_02670 [Xanthomonas sp. NCPPB 1128]|nr:hypothetical protein ACP93_02405 [Xanthomonas sp. NCPPB 1128]KMM77125.1 hypothetical protein ACP93_02670 [Xanthomonas sp. NCPPB 1128]